MTSAMLCSNRSISVALRRWAVGFALAAGFGLGSVVVPASSDGWPPHAASQPTITGTVQQGQTLTAVSGSRTDSRTAYSYQWLRCSSSGESCVAIAGATAQTYVPVAEDVGHELRVQQAAKDFRDFGRPERSAASTVVLPAAPTIVAPPVTPVVVSGKSVTITRRGEA